MDITNKYIELNGSKQNIMIMSTDYGNPVLLIVHGGAGMPDRPLVKEYSSELAEHYTVVCWDQRGSGLSYKPGKLTVDIILSDLKALTEYLLKEYGKEKIYLAGHSWGSYLGARFVYMYPEYIEYYIGTGQKVSSIASEIDEYNFLKDIAAEKNAKTMLRLLGHFGEPEEYRYKNADTAAKLYVMAMVFLYGGYFGRNGPSMGKYMTEYVKIFSKHYGKKLPAYLLGLVKSLILLNPEMEFNDTVSPITELKVPVLLISGEEDMVCPAPTAERWFNSLTAPKKEFVKIKNASHMVNFEKPQEWNRLVTGLLKENT